MFDPYTMSKLAETIHEERIAEAQRLMEAERYDNGPTLKERLLAFARTLTQQEARPSETRPTHQTREIPALH